MTRFSFRAYDAAGRHQEGVVSAPDETTALDIVAARGLAPYAVSGVGESVRQPWWSREVTLVGDGVPREALAGFLGGLALLLAARLPLLRALALAQEEVPHRALAATIAGAAAGIAEGGRLADALEGSPTLVPGRVVALIRVGEETNRLAETVAQAARLIEQEIAFRTELRAALGYPVILLVASILVVALILFYLAPTLAPVFAAAGSEPPWTIRTMVAVRDFAVDWWAPLGVSALLALGAAAVARQRSKRSLADLALRLPLIGTIVSETEAARTLGALGLLLASGSTLPTALRESGAVAGTEEFRRFFALAEDHVTAGGRFSDCLATDEALPVMARQMIRTGEEANRLAEMLGHAATALETRARHRIRRALQVLTPALTLAIGLLVGGLIFSTLSAVLDINDLALG